MVEKNWLRPANFPPQNHYLPNLERQPEEAAAAYATLIEGLLPLDFALLGIGEDGHTASLFPGHQHPEQIVVAVHDAPHMMLHTPQGLRFNRAINRQVVCRPGQRRGWFITHLTISYSQAVLRPAR